MHFFSACAVSKFPAANALLLALVSDNNDFRRWYNVCECLGFCITEFPSSN